MANMTLASSCTRTNLGQAFSTVRPRLPAVTMRRSRAAAVQIRAQAQDSEVGAAGLAAAAAGLIANPIVLWSEYTLATTGAGLQGDLLGAAEGVSYLVIVGLVAWSAITKVQTGSGLPAGPSGLLGAAEGFSYLSLLIGILVAGYQAIN